ncbi:MAG TPA: tripartite tricarboxylate transporter substrate binding protein [Burkholderiales bacterium]|jgi:tripartite-type tricarboxylate transporter receptor subunit TctC|nr:tripartite tricarboxylate transporter substrate binding protein [Burkholderiales bacterium]
MTRITCVSLFAALFALSALPASAAGYPEKPIRLLVPFAPGGGTDLLARALQDKLERALGVSVFVDNRTGAGGTIGFTLAARSAPDGYTLVVTSAAYTFIPGLYKNLPYDPVKDFRPLSMLTQQPLILAVHPSLPVKSVKDLLALARKRPKDLFYGSAGVGSNLHMTTELFKYMGKINLVPVAYKGGGPALIALITGEVQVGFMSVLSSKPFRQSGQVRPLAVTTKQRSPAVPDLPTIDEAGVPGYDKGSWTGMFAPAKVPDPIIAHIYQAVVKVLKDPESMKRFAEDGLVATASSPTEFTAFVNAEIAEWTKLAQEMKLPVTSLGK